MRLTPSLSLSRSGKSDRLLSVALATAWVAVAGWAAFVQLNPWPDVLLRNDFISFWTGASLLRDGVGSGLFDLETQRGFEGQLRLSLATVDPAGLAAFPERYFYYPAPLALLLVPLTLLPMSWAFGLWSALSLAAFVAAVALPLRGVPFGRTLAITMVSYLAVLDTLLEGQVNALILLAFSLGLLAFTRGRPFVGGLLVGLMLLKPQYAVLFPVIFLLKGRWRELGGMATAGAVIAALSIALVGVQGTVLGLTAAYDKGVSFPPPMTMVNWRALLASLWPDLLLANGSTPVLALGAVTLLVSLLAWRGSWDATSARFPSQMLVLMLATLVAIPHSHFHGMVLLLAPLALALRYPSKSSLVGWSYGLPLLLGYLLAFVSWPDRIRLLVPFLLLVLGILVAHCWREANRP